MEDGILWPTQWNIFGLLWTFLFAAKERPKTFEEILFPHGWNWSRRSKDIRRILKTCTSEGEKEKHYSEWSANGSDTDFAQSSLGWKQRTEGWKLSTFLMVSPRCKGMPKNFRGNPLSTWMRLVTALQGYPKNSEDLHKRGRERKALLGMICQWIRHFLRSKLSRLEATHWRLEIVDLPYGFPLLQRNAQKLSRNSSFHMAEIGHSTPRISKEFWRLAQARARKKSPTR